MVISFNDRLIGLLKTDFRFVDDEGEIVKAAVIDRAWKIDRELVKLLLSDGQIKEKFFDEIEGHWIFNINTFIDYVSDKNFLDNSYTRFRNRIGLNINGKFLRERGEVSLAWPYKAIVLDFFAGSGTTAHAVLELNKEDGGNRNFILYEQMHYVESVTRERVRKVIENNKSGDFIYCELMKYNEAWMDKIQETKTSEELIEIWKDIAENSFLNWYVNPEMPEEAIMDFEKIGKVENGLEKQKKLLCEMLNKNQLYVNLSEIKDEKFVVSNEDKVLNRTFYGEAYNG